MYFIISIFTIISVHTEKSYKLWIYLYRGIYFSKVYLHRYPISTKALLQLISSLHEDIIRMKEKERERREKNGAVDVFYFFLQERDNILCKACHKMSARICGTHHIYNFSKVVAFGFLFFR